MTGSKMIISSMLILLDIPLYRSLEKPIVIYSIEIKYYFENIYLMEDLPVQRHMTSFQYKFKNDVYLKVLKDLGDKDKAETLANVWFNVHFLGCKYGEEVMKEVDRYTSQEYLDYVQRRKL